VWIAGHDVVCKLILRDVLEENSDSGQLTYFPAS